MESLNEQDLSFLTKFLDDREKMRNFINTYFHILSSGMGDGITESFHEIYHENELLENMDELSLDYHKKFNYINEKIKCLESYVGEK